MILYTNLLRSLFLSGLFILPVIGTRKIVSSEFDSHLAFGHSLDVHANEDAIRREAEKKIKEDAERRKRIADEKKRAEEKKKREEQLARIREERRRQQAEERKAQAEWNADQARRQAET